jgi:hypothetical protein
VDNTVGCYAESSSSAVPKRPEELCSRAATVPPLLRDGRPHAYASKDQEQFNYLTAIRHVGSRGPWRSSSEVISPTQNAARRPSVGARARFLVKNPFASSPELPPSPTIHCTSIPSQSISTHALANRHHGCHCPILRRRPPGRSLCPVRWQACLPLRLDLRYAHRSSSPLSSPIASDSY